MDIKQNVTQLVGNTPLMRLNNIEAKYNVKAKLVAKLEFLNPTGSAKDRIAVAMLEKAKQDGRLNKDTLIIEPTSGNTGIGLASACASQGYKIILTMPDTMSEQRRTLLKAYGATLVLTEGAKGMQGAVDKAYELSQENPNSFIPSQFENPENPNIHYKTTGAEIFSQTDGEVFAVVAGVGTGGTISGIAKYLKEINSKIKTVAVEPASSPLLTQNKSGAHKIQGIGANFVPATFDRTVIDEIVTVTDDDAITMAAEIAKAEGILVGISSGAAVDAAIKLAQRSEFFNQTIVIVLPDSGDRYL